MLFWIVALVVWRHRARDERLTDVVMGLARFRSSTICYRNIAPDETTLFS